MGRGLENCAHCGRVRVVTLVTHLCQPCTRRRALTQGVCYERWVETDAGVRLLAASHRLAWVFVEVWLLPRGTCLYVAARWLLYVEYGVFPGMIAGPAKLKPRSGPSLAHLESLRAAGYWPPPGNRPVVVCMFPGESLSRFDSLPPAARSRLHAVPFTLSRRGICRDTLRARCQGALGSAGVSTAPGRSTAAGHGSRRFCETFYPADD